jgi:hypothetical protein
MPKEAKFKRKGEDTSTATILKNLLVLVPAYYATFYIWVAIVSSAMVVPIDGLEPFAFATMNPAAGGRAAATWIAWLMQILTTGVLVYFIPKSMVMSNDYVWTLGIFHWILSMLVMLSFPVNWIWWVTTIAVHLPVGFAAEVACHYLRDMRTIKVDHD